MSKYPMTTIRVRIEEHGEYYTAESPDLPGLHLIGESRKDVLNDIPKAVEYLYKTNKDIDVYVCRMVKPAAFPRRVYDKDRFVVSPQAAYA